MNTQEAIEIVCVGREKLLTFEETHKIVECLREGEKYKKYKLMWKGLEPFKEILVTADCFISKCGKESLGMKMYELEQKYFPKGDD